MDAEILTWIFLGGGAFLMLLELALPGGVAFFLGLSAFGVGITRFLGILSDPGTSLAVWLLASVGLTIAIRPFIKKYFKGDTFFKLADEDYEAMDKVAEVTEPLTSDDNSGRIRFNGISWQARSMDGPVPAGQKVRIKYRENTTWIVEPIGIIDPPDNKLKERNRN